MSSPTPVDPYGVLGVSKESSTSEIRTAYRKLVLKCHPDKIKDEAQRTQAQDEFQRVQEAYELLSDDIKRKRYDQKVRLAELKKENLEREGAAAAAAGGSSPSQRPSASYEYRGGRRYEEKIPRFFENDIPFSEEPRTTSRKYDGYRSSSKVPEERKKTKPAESKRESSKSTKEKPRESLRTSREDRARHRDKERRREFSDKYSRTAAYVLSDNEPDSDDSYGFPEFPAPKSKRETRTAKKSDAVPKSEPKRYKDSDHSDSWESSKHGFLQDHAWEYIQRARGSLAADREPRPTWPGSQAYYDIRDSHHGDTARRSSAKARLRPGSSGKDRRPSVEVVEPSLRTHSSSRKVPSMPVATSAPSGLKVPPGLKVIPPAPIRSATTVPAQEKREPPPIRRSETLPTVGTSRRTEPVVPKSSKLRDLYDSGYSSPGTPEMHQGSSPPKSSKYMIVEEDDDYSRPHRTVLIDPTAASHRRHQSTSPAQREATPIMIRGTPKHSRSRSREISPRHDSSRSIQTLRASPQLRSGSSRGLFGEISSDEYQYQKFSDEQVRYSPKIKQEDVSFGGYSTNMPRDIYPRGHKADRQGVSRKESYAY